MRDKINKEYEEKVLPTHVGGTLSSSVFGEKEQTQVLLLSYVRFILCELYGL